MTSSVTSSVTSAATEVDDEAAPVLPVIDALPRLAAFGLTALGLVGTPLMLLGRFDRVPVLLGTALLLVGFELAWRRWGPPTAVALTRQQLAVSLLALLVAVLSTLLNVRYGSQHLLVDGDPAVYAVTGQLLAETGSLRIETQAQALFGGGDQLNYAGAGFDAVENEAAVRPSFLHLLPQALAVASWVGGPRGLLWANAGIGGLALLAVFAFGARLLRRPGWALVAMTALALSLPQQHFSRGTYSELPAQLLVFAGLALLHDAVRSRRAVPGLLAGLVLGISCAARIDAFLYLVPVVLVATVLVLAGRSRVAAGLAAGAAAGGLVGYADLRLGSANYLALQQDNLDLILLLLGATVLACAAALVLRTRAAAMWQRLSGRALAATVAGALALLSLYAGLLRPYVETGRNLSPAQPTAVAQLQEQAGVAVDPLRSYDELSVQWLSWYLGPVAVALGLAGLVGLTYYVLRRPPRPADARRALLALAFLLLFGASTALYLWRPSIIPVHYWASRRFLPVTIPGLLLLAAGLAAVVRGRWSVLVRAGVALGLLVPPLLLLPGHLTERDYVPMLAATRQICDALEPGDAVLLEGGAAISTALPQTISTFCGTPVAVLDAGATVDDVEASRAAAQSAGRRLVMISDIPDPVVLDGPVPGSSTPVLDVQVTVVALSLLERPDEEFAFPLRLFLTPLPAVS